MKLEQRMKALVTRRHFFKDCGVGIGSIALTSLLNDNLFGQSAIRHFAPKAKNVIFLFMAGGPSQLDLFDPKPLLNKYNDKPIPEELVKGERFAFIKGTPLCLGSPFKFSKHGESGAVVSELLPHLAKHADELALIRSMQTTQLYHAPAQIFMNTTPIEGRRQEPGAAVTSPPFRPHSRKWFSPE